MLWSVGEATYGQLGVAVASTLKYSRTPLRVVSDAAWTDVVTGWSRSHTCAFDDDSVLYCFGYGNNGEIGDGTTASQWLPTAVEADGVVFTAVATGYGFTCATGGVLSSSPPVAMDPPVIVDIDENSTYLLVTFDEPDFKAGRTVVMYYLNCTNTVNGTSHTGMQLIYDGSALSAAFRYLSVTTFPVLPPVPLAVSISPAASNYTVNMTRLTNFVEYSEHWIRGSPGLHIHITFTNAFLSRACLQTA